MNILALNKKFKLNVSLFGIIGDDENGKLLISLLKKENDLKLNIIKDPKRRQMSGKVAFSGRTAIALGQTKKLQALFKNYILKNWQKPHRKRNVFIFILFFKTMLKDFLKVNWFHYSLQNPVIWELKPWLILTDKVFMYKGELYQAKCFESRNILTAF